MSWKDLTPRLAAAYDLTGNGKTAIKASINKYVIAQGVQGVYGDSLAPVNRLANFVTRNWTDGNQNFVPDCDLTSPLDQNFLGDGRRSLLRDVRPELRQADAEHHGRSGGDERFRRPAV